MHSKRFYYDAFSSFYDRFVRLHSGDRQETMRDFLAEVACLQRGQTVVDLCTGTGASALRLARAGVRVIGVDFSEGMLRQARRKSVGCSAIHWVQADARALPLASCMVDCVTCSYAMYELSGKVAERSPARSNPHTQARRYVCYDGAPPSQAAGRQAALFHSNLPSRQQRRQIFRLLRGKGIAQFFSGGWNGYFSWRENQGSLRL